MTLNNTSRRDFLRLSTVGLAGSALLAATPSTLVADVAAAQQKAVARGDRPKRIIFLVSDGMSQAVPSLTELLSLKVRNRGTYFARMLQDPKVAHGFFETYALDSVVTDSAAGGSAWGSGTRVFNGALNWLPGGVELKPIFHIAKEKGWGTGVVTTTTVSNATPASFVVSHPTRGPEDPIAEKYLDVADVIMGGGTAHFKADKRSDSLDLEDKFRKAGYKIVEHRDELMSLGAEKKVLATFHDGLLPYTVDQLQDEEAMKKIPTLAEMTDKAINCLEANNPDGWILQVEGARIDHAAHGNDAAGAIWDQLAFDDAIGVALAFAAREPDTLVVVTSDHGNANPGLSAFGRGTRSMFETIAQAKASTGPIRAALRPHADSPADIREVVREMLSVNLSGDDAALVSRMLNDDFSMVVNRLHRNFSCAFNALIGNHIGVGWVGSSHTEDYVILAAMGPMQHRLNALLPNTEAFRVMADAMGSDFRNPTMTFEEAMQHASASPGPIIDNGIVHA
ncbi:MAG: alkaline phosphatase [Candidatus Sumerlaeia bacterium]|nr:alkaline phosphatase [Candidatus Sumerlaeia bacterium]